MPDLSLNPNIGTQRAPRVSPYPDASLYLDFLTMSANFMDSRITFSRGTNATLTDSTGRLTYAPNNQLLSSEDFDAAYWAKARGSITANVATAPNGTTTADLLTATSTGTYAAAFRSGFTFIGATQYVYSVYAKASVGQYLILYINETGDVGRAIFDLNSGAISSASVGTTASITPVGNGWWRCVVSATPSTTTLGIVIAGVVDSGTVTTVTSGKSILLWGAQLEQVTYQTTPSTYVATTSAAYYGPRFDYDPVTLAARGLLIEEQRTNLLTYSEQFDNAAWTKSNATVTGNATMSPDGTMDAEMMIETTASGTHGVWQLITTSSGTTYTYSAYLKYRTRRYVRFAFVTSSGNQSVYADVDLIAGTIVNQGPFSTATQSGATISNVGNGWYRVSVTGTLPSGTTYASIYLRDGPSNSNPESAIGYTGDGTSGIYIWGAQLEAGAFATSYIPTVASTVTRNADVATMTGTNFSDWYNQSEGTFVVAGSSFTVPSFSYPLLASDNSFANRFGIYTSSSSAAGLVVSSSVTQMDISASSIVANVPFKAAVAAQANSGNFSLNGSIGTTDTTITMPVVNRLTIGAGFVGIGEYINGHIRTIVYFNTRQPNTQLQTLTAPALVPSLSLDFINNVYNVGF